MNRTEWLIVASIVLILAAIGYKSWQEHKSEKIVLVKSEFKCTEEKTETQYRPQLVGKVIVQMPYNAEICGGFLQIRNAEFLTRPQD